MKTLNDKLPVGSYVLMIGMIDGRVLWDHSTNHTHPLGSKYEDVYGFLNCAECNRKYYEQCKFYATGLLYTNFIRFGYFSLPGWLNKNESLRNETTKWAESLNAQYEIIMETAKTDFPNLNLRYFYAPLQEMIENYVKKGGAASDVIEPSDGFHPSQLGNELLGELLWNHLS